MEKDNTRDLIIDPPCKDIKIDTTSILSFSMRNERIVLITEDFEAKAYGNNTDGILSVSLPREYLQEFTQFDIKDNEGCIWYPISAAICMKSTLYMVSKFKRGYKKMLVYNGIKTKSNLPILLPFFIVSMIIM